MDSTYMYMYASVLSPESVAVIKLPSTQILDVSRELNQMLRDQS